VLTTLGVSAGTAAARQGTPPPPTAPRSPLSVPADDPRVVASEIGVPAEDGATIGAYQAVPSAEATPAPGTPATGAPFPLVLVCHENRGLTDHIRDVARRFAANGYVACAVDLLSREGGTANVADPSAIPSILSEGDPSRHVADFRAAIASYATVPEVDSGRIAMNGYCFGGGITWRTIQAAPEIRAAAPFYGPPPPLEQVASIQAAVLGVYAEDPNDFANEGREELATALAEAGVVHQINVYPGTQHAFHNDTGQRYNEEQALAAWTDTLAWFAEHLTA
jgi:carboxymethylenebutenolidase